MIRAALLITMLAASGYSCAQALNFSVKGLEAPAEILVDEWGVPHIYANTHYDAFFVQGFNAARDRLWQIDLWRKRGLGELSSILGSNYIKQDEATRLFLYRGDMYREWLAYGSDAKRIAEAFTAGVNAYVALTEQNPELLPPEFGLLGYRPAKWQASEVVRIRSHGLLRNVPMEVRRARIVCEQGLETAAKWRQLEPNWTTTIPKGFDPCVVPADVLELYHMAKAPVQFPGQFVAYDTTLTDDEKGYGSNNWAVAPERTNTGRPILADDPHRGHAVPSLRYIAHLVAPDLNVIGAGEPALPGISIGHNGKIAFGLTIFPMDHEDLYVYERRGNQYLYEGRWENVRTLEEKIPVKDSVAASVQLSFTRHGPIIHRTKDNIFAVRAAWLEPGMAPYFGSVEYMRAESWREFEAALNRWGAPSENQVYADSDGNIGYKPAGLFPRRPNWDGLMPVPGDGRYEWNGFFDMDVLPSEFNPQRGFTGTANSMNLPGDYPIAKYPIGFEWNDGWRYQRLWQVLSEQDAHTLDDSKDLQRDFVSLLAREAIARIPKDDQQPAAQMLREFDADMTANSSEAALYAVWFFRHLRPGLEKVLSPNAPELVASLDTRSVLALMEDHPEIVSASLEQAWAQTRKLLGENPENWRWGDLHQIRFQHPLLNLASGDLKEQMKYPAYGKGGTANTTNNTGFTSDSFDVRGGASYRQVIDVGNWDTARMTNAPGQSGDPRSPFYANLLEGWANEEDFPLIYSRELVEKHTVLKIELKPSP